MTNVNNTEDAMHPAQGKPVRARRAFIIEVSTNGKDWVRNSNREYAKAKLAYPDARDLWLSTKRWVRSSSFCTEYQCSHVRIRRIDGTRAVDRFPPFSMEYNRTP